MRKLVKKTLDELAKIMPVITENAQNQIIGAIKFYNLSGVYLGGFGGSDELRFVGEDTTFGDIIDRATSIMAPGPAESLAKRQEDAARAIGSTWSNISNEARIEFATVLINSEPALSPLRGLEFMTKWNSGNAAAIIAKDVETGEIYLGISNKETFFGTYSQAASTLVHEAYHAGGSSGTVSSNEMAAYDSQVKNSHYANTSETYKLEVARGACYNQAWRPELKDEGERRRAAAILFGVDANKI